MSREYTLNLDSGAVDDYNKALYNLKETFDEFSFSTGTAGSYEPDYLDYKRSFITRGEEILFAPTAVPVTIR